MISEGAKEQVKKWVKESIKKAQDPDPRVKLKEERKKRAKEVEKKYGLT